MPASPTLRADPPDALVDTPVRLHLDGLPPGRRATLRLELTDDAGRAWRSWATFAADARGAVDVAAQPPLTGTYAGADAMGLFWSAALDPTAPEISPFVKTTLEPITAELAAEVEGRVAARATLARRYLTPGVRRVEPPREAALVGALFVPAGAGPHPVALWLGGSGGGTREQPAALLAAHGIATLALAYFGAPGLPPTLARIPLEYFDTALDWLRTRQELRAERVGVVGSSRGAELALLLGTRTPRFGAVVAYAPSSVLWGGVNSSAPAWTSGGADLPAMPDRTSPEQQVAAESSDPLVAAPLYLANLADAATIEACAIPVGRIAGPALLISGEDDALWPSALMGDMVLERLRRAGHPYPDTHLRYPDAGHLVGYPYLPTTVNARRHPAVGRALAYGGTPAGAARANADSWPRVLAFLRDTLR